MILLSILWFLRTIKNVLFYIYLWQLKEYHFGRFIDHFRTSKGKSLFFNRIYGLKTLMAVIFLVLLPMTKYLGRAPFLTTLIVIIFLLYIAEVFVFFKNIFARNFLKPVFTKKILFLTAFSMALLAIFFIIFAVASSDNFVFPFGLLLLDILTVFLVSFSVLIVQPFVVFYRTNFILKKAEQKIASRKDLIVIGITGSYGKTTTKEFLSEIISSKCSVLKTDKHQNSEMGIAQCILKNLKPEHQVFIVEMGAYGLGGIKLLAKIAKPKIGILTGINEQHLALFGSQENIIKTKYELIQSLPKDGLAVFNGDNKYCLELFKATEIPKKLFKIGREAKELSLKPDIWAENIIIDKDCVFLDVFTKKGEKANIRANVLGKQNISNILASILVASQMGMSIEEIKKAILKIKPEQGSLVLRKGSKDLNIFDSSYSANPDGVLADLEYFKLMPRLRVIIMPCLIELGRTSEEIHKKIGEKIGEVCDLAIITASERFEDLKNGAVSSGMPPENILLLEKAEDILVQLDISCHRGDSVLLEGRVPEKLIKELIIEEIAE